MANSYRIEEIQDSEGNVVYPQTDARGVWLPDGSSAWDFLKEDVADEQIAQILMD